MKYAHRLMMQGLEDRSLMSAAVADARLAPELDEVAVVVSVEASPKKAPPVVLDRENGRTASADVVYFNTNDPVIGYGSGFSEHHVGTHR